MGNAGTTHCLTKQFIRVGLASLAEEVVAT
jgi:hypothetical protein